MQNQKGFTIIELIVVIAIIAVLSGIVVVNTGQYLAKTRDAKRLSDMHTIQLALQAYYEQYGYYPASLNLGCGGWDIGYKDYSGNSDFIKALITSNILRAVPVDPSSYSTDCSNGYQYGSNGNPVNNWDNTCNIALHGAYYILGIRHMETSGAKATSPVFNCDGRDFQSEFDWVTGAVQR